MVGLFSSLQRTVDIFWWKCPLCFFRVRVRERQWKSSKHDRFYMRTVNIFKDSVIIPEYKILELLLFFKLGLVVWPATMDISICFRCFHNCLAYIFTTLQKQSKLRSPMLNCTMGLRSFLRLPPSTAGKKTWNKGGVHIL